MVGGGKAAAMNICIACGERRKKFPASWTLHGDSVYCSQCWENVKCTHCCHHDPKGDIFKGRWTCQGCRHQLKVKFKGSLYEDCHRVIIEDCNGEVALEQAETKGVIETIVHQDFLQAEEGDEEWEDELAPLPMPCATTRRMAPIEQGHVVLLIDASGSMRNIDVIAKEEGEQPDVICRLEAATRCAVKFVHAHARMQPRDQFSLATFGDTAALEGRALTSTDMRAVLESLPQRGTGGTSYMSALQAAADLITSQPAMRSHVVLLSDGRPADTKVALQFFETEFLRGKCAGTRIHGIGFGATVQSFAALQQLACLSGGTFVLSTCTIQGLSQAFSSVSSTITTMSSGCFTGREDSASKRALRPVTFEPPENGEFGRKDVLRFHAERTVFQYDGTVFKKEHCPPVSVARRLRPCMRGGMRLVYGFRDTEVVRDEGSWMVAKASRFLDESCNTQAVVESHAKSTAVARYYAARFNERLRCAIAHKQQSSVKPLTIFFVPCHVYSMTESEICDQDEPRVFAGERFLPGAFLKYNSNNGYVCDESVRHHEAVQAFTHFSYIASGGQLLVADLQGVARDSETLLTDPQVLSLKASFGPGDLGARGMRACLAAHRCGPTCKMLGLEPLGIKALHRLAPDGGATPHAALRPASRPSSALSSSGWERVSEPDGSEQWDKVSEAGLSEFALNDDIRSSQGSSCSWVHVQNR